MGEDVSGGKLNEYLWQGGRQLKRGGTNLGMGQVAVKQIANVLTHEIRVRGIRLCARYDWGGGIEFQASKERGNKLGNGSGCHETDAADVLIHQIQVGGIRLVVSGDLAKFWSWCDYISRSQMAHNIVALSIHYHVRPQPWQQQLMHNQHDSHDHNINSHDGSSDQLTDNDNNNNSAKNDDEDDDWMP